MFSLFLGKNSNMVKLDGIRNIIFDLGGVLLNLDPRKTLQEFEKLGHVSLVETNPWDFQHEIFYKFERGLISIYEFHAGIKEILANGATDEQIDHAWTAMLLDIPKIRVNIVLNLKKKFNTYLFSNTNAIHVQKIQSDFREQHGIELPSLFMKDYYSNEIQVRKPDLESFLKVIELSGVNPEETLFVDDFEKNIKGAQASGLRTFWLEPGMTIEETLSGFR